jgi:hypothetical protein
MSTSAIPAFTTAGTAQDEIGALPLCPLPTVMLCGGLVIRPKIVPILPSGPYLVVLAIMPFHLHAVQSLGFKELGVPVVLIACQPKFSLSL